MREPIATQFCQGSPRRVGNTLKTQISNAVGALQRHVWAHSAVRTPRDVYNEADWWRTAARDGRPAHGACAKTMPKWGPPQGFS